jgi:hypothetical protein
MEFLYKQELSSFVIRIWKDDDRSQWRGHITHIQSRQGGYFITLSQMEDFMSRFISSFQEEFSSIPEATPNQP